MSDIEKKKIHNKLTYLKRKIIEKIKVFHDFGAMDVSLTFLGGSRKDKKFRLSSKPRIDIQPSQNVRESLKAEISRLCLKYVEADSTNEERD